jgi:hypothetical protein
MSQINSRNSSVSIAAGYKLDSQVDFEGFWRWCMMYRTMRFILDFIHRPVYIRQKITTFRRLDLSPSSFYRAQLSRTILPHPPEDGDRSSLRNIVIFCHIYIYQTMDIVQNKPYSSVLPLCLEADTTHRSRPESLHKQLECSQLYEVMVVKCMQISKYEFWFDVPAKRK